MEFDPYTIELRCWPRAHFAL